MGYRQDARGVGMSTKNPNKKCLERLQHHRKGKNCFINHSQRKKNLIEIRIKVSMPCQLKPSASKNFLV